ncbi:MAG: PAS domain S-box protein [Chloroflexi bacterium]|nr:PAS domain S-box protein [Chloroflexota bacterium]
MAASKSFDRIPEGLHDGEQLLSKIYDTVADVIFLLTVEKDGRYRFTSVNTAFYSVTGLTSDQVVGKRVDEVIPEPSLTLVLERYGKAIREKRSVRWEETSEYPTGKLVGEVSIAPAFDEAGHCTHLVGAVHDITERKRAEEALRTSEERYRNTLDNMLEGCQIIGYDWRYLYINNAAAGHGRRAKQGLLGHTMMEIYPGIEDTEMFAFLRRCMEKHTPHRMENQFTFPNGDTGWFELSIQPVPEGIFILSADITELKQAEEELKKSNRRLEETLTELQRIQQHVIQQERLWALGQMASGIVHDFSNALTPILGFSEILLNRPEALENREKVREYLGKMHTAAQDAASVVRRLSHFYRRREEAEPFQAVDLNHLVQEVVSLTQPKWAAQAQSKGVSIRIEVELQPIPPIRGNEGELREALTNLIFNAVDAMPQGGTMTAATRLEGDQAVLAVEDTGVGMTEEVRRRCFEPFFITTGEQGTGLGLAVVYGIVQRHGGTIEVESEVGKGTTFRIRLPVQTPPEEGSGRETAEGPLRHLHVLVVDDEPLVREVVASYLGGDGHTVETAGSGREALAVLHAGHTFDLVLTDGAMPQMSGAELAARIKGMMPATPIFMLSGFGDAIQATGEKPANVDQVVPKPVTLAQLREALAVVTRR